MDFETFLTEAAKGYTPRHDEHNAAVAIVKKHTAGVEHSDGNERTELTHHTAVHKSKHDALHKALTSAGFAHKVHSDSSSYKKGNTSVHVDKDSDVGAKIDEHGTDHHQVTVSTSHARTATKKHTGPKTPKPAMYD